MKKSETVYWTTCDGRKLRPSQMETTHLRNIILFVQRNLRRRIRLAAKEALLASLDAIAYASSTGGEMASYYARQAADEEGERAVNLALASRDPKFLFNTVFNWKLTRSIILEAERRGVPRAEMYLTSPYLTPKRKLRARKRPSAGAIDA